MAMGKNRGRGKNLKHKFFTGDDISAYIIIAPFFLFFLLFVLFPIFSNLLTSFTNYDLGRNRDFIGIENYIKLFKDDQFIRSVRNTVVYAFFSVIPLMVLGFFTAVAVNGKSRILSVIRVAFIFPYITSMVAVSMIWLYLYEPSSGMFNKILLSLGFNPKLWLFDETLAMPSLIGMNVWKNIGYVMIIYLAGLQSIPGELYEAGKVDGASEFRMIFKITLPAVSPISFFLLVTTAIESFKTFEQVRIMTGGGPVNATTTIVHQIYLRAFSEYKMGYASAMSMVLLGILLAVTIINMRFGSTYKDT